MNGFETLWRTRRQAFLRETSIYWRDVGRSGFFSILILALIAGIYGYAKALKTLPADFPYLWIILPLLSLTVASGRIRTFLREADRVFLLPAEDRLQGYFRLSFRHSFLMQGIRLLLVLLAVWPLYHKGAGTGALPYWWLAAFLLLTKWAGLLTVWQQARCVSIRHGRLIAAYRWAACTMAVYGLFRFPLPYAFLLLLGLALTGVLLLRSLPKFRIPWEALLRSEKAQRDLYYLFSAGSRISRPGRIPSKGGCSSPADQASAV
ncbi:ABC transporter permease [Paenibacillus sp. CC-CFT747]|nr:ABC transporter permease [Paenibacillus sp. CC-CFT747]